MEFPCDRAQVFDLEADRKRAQEHVFEVPVVKETVDESRPVLFEGNRGADLVLYLDQGREAGFQWVLSEDALGESVKRLYGRAIEFGQRAPTAAALLFC